MDTKESIEGLRAGTGFMASLPEAIERLSKLGYVENLVPCFDHLSCRQGKIRMYPPDFKVDRIARFENSSDPADTSILYAISSAKDETKGLYLESYGVYHDSLSTAMIERLKDHPH